MPKTYYVVASGKISGTFADGFHRVSEDGKIGYFLDRVPTTEEKQKILIDVIRHRDSLNNELSQLAAVEQILKDK